MNSKNNDYDKLLNSIVFVVKIVFFLLVFFTLYIFLYYKIKDSAGLVHKEEYNFIDHWTVIKNNGETFSTGRVFEGDEAFDNYSIVSKVPDYVEDNMYLCFRVRDDLEVYINGELRMDYIESRDVNIPGGIVKKFYMMVPVGKADAGAELRIDKSVCFKLDQVVPETIVGTQSAIFTYLFMTFGRTFVLAMIILIFSLVVMVVSVGMVFRFRKKIDMFYGAMGTFIISSWIATDSLLFPMLFGHYHIDGIINYILGLLIPFGPAFYLNSIQNGRYKKSMSVILACTAINSVLWPSLHFTGIFTFREARNYVNATLVSLCVIAIVILIVDVIKGNAKVYKFTAIGFGGFLAGAIFEIAYAMLGLPNDDVPTLVLGLGFFLLFVVIEQAEDFRNSYAEKQRAIDMSETKTKFLANMSHEIRTPINAILGMNEMILRENTDKDVEEYSRSIQSSGKMLLMLVNDVLDFSKIEAGKLEIVSAEFNMSEVLYDVMALIMERAAEKSLMVEHEVASDVPSVEISDEFRIRQILINILSNAVKYTDKGNVHFYIGGQYLSDDKYELEFRVKDTGRGIKKEEQEHLFEAFQRADVKKNVNIEGTGLGLAIVKNVVDSMKGSIEVYSEYGKGSEFVVKIPVGVADKTPLNNNFLEIRSTSEYINEEAQFTAPEAAILAVDDNQSNLTIVKLFLKRLGIKPDLCNNGTEALKLCKKKKYDILLLDHMMPEPDGIETLKMIKTDPDSLNKDTKTVVLTANAVAGSREIYLDAGFDDYLTKPLDITTLEKTVEKFLPPEKVISMDDMVITEDDESDNGVFAEFFPEDHKEISEDVSTLREKLSAIEGLDYDEALKHTAGDEEILQEIISDMTEESAQRVKRMREYLKQENYHDYEIDAHAVKGIMLTMGLQSFSERAKKHEFAAKKGDIDFIKKDAEEFITEYESVCRKLADSLKQ